MSRYAQGTTVPPERSRAEIERMLERYGAEEFVVAWKKRADGVKEPVLGFWCADRSLRFSVPMPSAEDPELQPKRPRGGPAGRARALEANIRGEEARRWRALALVIKAKLEAVESGITTFEQEFLAHIVMPDGVTIGDHVRGRLEKAYQTGRVSVAGLLGPASA